MSTYISLISSSHITRADSEEIILQEQGKLFPIDQHAIGFIARGSAYIRMYPPEIIDIVDSDWEENVAELEQLLADIPRSCTLIYVGYGSGSHQLAIAFASLCMQRWTCVVEAPDGSKFYTREEIEVLRNEKKRFYD